MATKASGTNSRGEKLATERFVGDLVGARTRAVRDVTDERIQSLRDRIRWSEKRLEGQIELLEGQIAELELTRWARIRRWWRRRTNR